MYTFCFGKREEFMGVLDKVGVCPPTKSWPHCSGILKLILLVLIMQNIYAKSGDIPLFSSETIEGSTPVA